MSPVLTEPLHLRESGGAELLETEGVRARDQMPLALLGPSHLIAAIHVQDGPVLAQLWSSSPFWLAALLLERLHLSEVGWTDVDEAEGLRLRDQTPLAMLIAPAASLMANAQEHIRPRDLTPARQLQKHHGPH